MLKNQGQIRLLPKAHSKAFRRIALPPRAALHARSIHVSPAVANKTRRRGDARNAQQSIGGIFEPFLDSTVNKQSDMKTDEYVKLPATIGVQDILPQDSELQMLLDNKQIGLSVEKQKLLVKGILQHLKNDTTVNGAELLKLSENKASELAALGNIVIRTSTYGAPVALELYRAAMDGGDDRGGFSFASMVYRGYRGVPKDEELGIKVMSELARKGHPYAQMNLASIIMRTQPDQVASAIKLYELAAKSGVDNAYVELGRMHRIGYGVHQDHKKAMDYFQRGAQQGSARCMFMLGVYYSTNQVVAEDQKKAFKHFQKAAMRGLPEAQYNVGLRFLKGHGVESNAFNAAEFFKMAAGQGFQLAQANLATMYLEGHGVNKDLSQARHWYQAAAEKGGNIGKEAQKALDGLDGPGTRAHPSITLRYDPLFFRVVNVFWEYFLVHASIDSMHTGRTSRSRLIFSHCLFHFTDTQQLENATAVAANHQYMAKMIRKITQLKFTRFRYNEIDGGAIARLKLAFDTALLSWIPQ